MGSKRRTEIQIEIERSFSIKKPGRPVRAWCVECAEAVTLITPEEAALAARVSSRTIYRWAEDGKLHFAETPEGFLRICLNSLVRDQNH